MHVAPFGNDSNSGLTWGSAKATLQGGVDAAVDGGTVLVSNGIYVVSNEVLVTKDIGIYAINGPQETIVDGGGSSRCFSLVSTCVVSGLTVTNGDADYGGGILCFDTIPIVTNCIIKGNTASRYGGGIVFGTVLNSVIAENNAETRGGAALWTVLYNSLVDSNVGNDGGGLYDGDAYNCTIVNNQAYRGGGIYNCRAYNCIIFGNTAAGTGDNIYDAGAAVLVNSCSPDAVLGIDENSSDNPLFVDAANGDYRLQSNSPCINWGNNGYGLATVDLDGNPRIVENYVDMGCYEYQGTVGLNGDLNRNGLVDEWEREYFGGQVKVDPERNTDGDSLPDVYEYIAGTDPTNGSSFFMVTHSLENMNETNGFVVEWVSVPDRLYSVQWSTNLLSGFETMQAGIEHPQNSYTDTVHSVKESGYYKVDVKLK
jgi:hypothetical protein